MIILILLMLKMLSSRQDIPEGIGHFEQTLGKDLLQIGIPRNI